VGKKSNDRIHPFMSSFPNLKSANLKKAPCLGRALLGEHLHNNKDIINRFSLPSISCLNLPSFFVSDMTIDRWKTLFALFPSLETLDLDIIPARSRNNVHLSAPAQLAFHRLLLQDKYSFISIKLAPMESSRKYIEWELDLIGDQGISFEAFSQQFSREEYKTDGRHVIYNFKYTKDGKERKVVLLVIWIPDLAPIKTKMLTASCREGLMLHFPGINHVISANNVADVQESLWINSCE